MATLFDTTPTQLVVPMVTVTCYKCGLPFCVPKRWDDERRSDHANFYCPNGHAQCYTGKTALERECDDLRTKLARETHRAEQADEARRRAVRAAEHTERRRRAAKGQLTKLTKRVAAGVCPCCTRTFTNLAEHMRRQHPSFVPDTEQAAEAVEQVDSPGPQEGEHG